MMIDYFETDIIKNTIL